MKAPIQLFPQLLDSFNRLEESYKNHPSIEQQDIRASNFIKLLREEFDFKNIVNFRLPKNLEKISDMFAGISNEEIISNFIPNAKLPFPQIAIELEYDLKMSSENADGSGYYELKDIVILAKNTTINGEDFIEFAVNYGVEIYALNGKKKGKTFKAFDALIRFSTNPKKIDEDWITFILGDEFGFDEQTENSAKEFTMLGLSPLLFLLASLSCHNVEVQKDYPPSNVDNQKRIKKNLSPYKQLHYIVVKPTVKKGESNAAKGSHKPRSTHVRRGHIRRYEEKGISIWIESTIINGGVGQVKAKDYILR